MKTRKMQLKLLTVSICIAQQSYALNLIDENELSDVTGQDGLVITHEISKATIEKVNWYDSNGIEVYKDGDLEKQNNFKMGFGLHNVEILGKDNNSITTQLAFDVGATDNGTGLRIEASVSPFELTSNLNLVKINCGGSPCLQSNSSIRTAGTQTTQSLGKLGLNINSPFSMVLQTTAGLFNKNHTATIDFNLQDASIKHTLGNNSIVLNNFNFNFSGEGYIYVEPTEGIVLSSNNGTKDHFINLSPVSVGTTGAKTAGVNFDLRYQNGDGELKNIMRYGISGNVTNARLALNANQSNLNKFDVADQSQLQEVASYKDGGGGLHLNVSAGFTNKTDFPNQAEAEAASYEPTVLEIGHTGKNSYSVQFHDLRSLTGENRAYIDFGDIYINTIQAKSLEFYVNDSIKKTLGATTNKLTQTLGETDRDYALIAIRGMDFQSIATRANFVSNDTGITSGTGTWGIGIPIYNLNANVALSGGDSTNDNQVILYNIMASTEGYGIDKVTNSPSTTSIMLIDGAAGNNYYAGLRNIDAFVESNGTIGYEDKGIHIKADKLVFAADAELAIGRLPGTSYTYEGKPYTVADNSFSKRDDVLTNISLKLDGSANVYIIPGVNGTTGSPDSNFLSLEGDFKFRPLTTIEAVDPNNLGSYFSLSNIDEKTKTELVNGKPVETKVLETSAISFNRMEGDLGFKTNLKVKSDTVIVDTQVKLNRNNDLAQPFKTNFAMVTNGNMQNMASIALTGGTIRSTLGIEPR